MLLIVLLAVLGTLASAKEYGLYDDPHTWSNRTLMVHLFEWKWTDIAKECEDFLQYYGYGAVQISPPMEHITLVKNGDLPWWVRYQPVSYKLNSRSGTEAEFKDMVDRCNAVGVRIVVDTIMNHMTGVGQKKGVNTVGSSGDSDFDATDNIESFPSVPYTREHFDDKKCHGGINKNDYTCCADRVRNCRLVGLLDLDQSQEYVREKLVGLLDHFVDLGVAGFRLDASKHMWPEDLEVILGRVKNLRSDIFGENQRPLFIHEVTDRTGKESVKCAEYTKIGRYTAFNYGLIISQAAKRQNKGFGDLKWWGPGYGYGNLDDTDVLGFIDNHDDQRDGTPVVTYKNGNQYSLAVGFMLGWNYGLPRVMSSYYFSYSDQGPPSNGQAAGFSTRSPTFNMDKTCAQSSGWVCEHRWLPIRGMARFRAEVADSDYVDVISEDNRLAFGRGGKGYFALNNGNGVWSMTVDTGLPAGSYCDVWSGELQNGACTGVTVNVNSEGN
uniref:Alpha-amylase n=1 Tax=Syphacia muris TaxID=451379 RepID=A0A0N5AFH8_9BILA